MIIRHKNMMSNKIQITVLVVFWLSLIIGIQPATAQKLSVSESHTEVVKNKKIEREIDKQKTSSNTPTPMIIDVGIGTTDVRISEMGGLGVADFSQALESNIAYNPTSSQYLIVWRGDNQNDKKDEIYGQLLDAKTGYEIGNNDFIIAQMDGNENYDTKNPVAVYNETMSEYLVVWQGDHTANADETAEEIFARRIASDGSLLQLDGSASGQVNDYLRVSNMGLDDNNYNFDAFEPDVALNPVDNEYLIVWYGDSLKNGENGIFGQRLHFDNGLLSENGSDFQISETFPAGPEDNDSESPALVFNTTSLEWLVVWAAENGNADMYTIYGRRLSKNGTTIADPIQIGHTPAGDTRDADVVWNSTMNQYLAVWSGSNIYGQLLDNAGTEINSDFIIGSSGQSFNPQAAYNLKDNTYLVIWNSDKLQDGEYEVYGQELSGSGGEIGVNDMVISDMGPPGDFKFGVQGPQVSYGDTNLNSFMVVWSGDDNIETIDDELEIFGRIVGPEADLAINMQDGLTETYAGAGLIYTITISNNGPDEVVRATVSDNFPAELINITWNAVGSNGATGFESSGSGDINDININLPNGAGIIYTVTSIVDPTTPDNTLLTNSIRIYDEIVVDPLPANNSSTDDDTRVINQADLQISKDDNVTVVAPGGNLTYTITVTNNGPAGVISTTVTDTFPDQLTAVSWTVTETGGATGFESSGSGEIIDSGIALPNGARLNYTVLAKVNSGLADSTVLSNTAFVLDSIAVDPNLANNLSTDNNTMVLTPTGDVDPPVITVKDTLELWPPNHKYSWVWVNKCIISIKDSVDGEISAKHVVIDSVWSDEPDSSKFGFEFDQLDSMFADLYNGIRDDGDNDDEADNNDTNYNGDEDDDDDHTNFFPDIIIGPFCKTLLLRREREGEGNGRVYTIHISVSDSAGNKGTARCVVTIPHDQSGRQAIDDGPAYSVISRCADEPPITDLDDKPVAAVPEQINLYQNYPNPFNPKTTIRFDLAFSTFVQLSIYNILGQEVRVLVNSDFSAGSYDLIWNGLDESGRDVASGVYIYQLRAGDMVINKKLILMR